MTSSDGRNERDVTGKEIRPRPPCSRDATSTQNEPPTGTGNENDVTSHLESTEIASNGGADITVPGRSENEKREENASPRGRKYNPRPNPTPNCTEENRY